MSTELWLEYPCPKAVRTVARQKPRGYERAVRSGVSMRLRISALMITRSRGKAERFLRTIVVPTGTADKT